jgi:hypothetical protein
MTIVWSPEAAEDPASLRTTSQPQSRRRSPHASLIVEGRTWHRPSGAAGRSCPRHAKLVIPNTPVIIPYRVRERTLEILASITTHAAGPTVSGAAHPYGAAEAPVLEHHVNRGLNAFFAVRARNAHRADHLAVHEDRQGARLGKIAHERGSQILTASHDLVRFRRCPPPAKCRLRLQ